ncbi:MAG: Cysteine desulfurase [Ktedonobacterales bacterium]|nr:MAG: Cysteine desulfurase [Ktedonobacterales bacterium]
MQQRTSSSASAGARTRAKTSSTTGSTKRAASPKTSSRPGREPHRDLLKYREEFPILQHKTYLNSCSLGPLSLRSMAGMARFQEYWNEHGAQAWYSIWLGEIAAVREKVARLIGAQPHEIAIAPNVSIALSEITSGLDLGDRNKVVLAEMDFPTLAYQWLVRKESGVDIEFVRSEDGITLPAERFAAHIDDRTGLVATSRVFFLSGYIQDIKTLAETAHRNGSLLLVDDYQGTGQIPIDVKALGIDFLVTGTLKWLMGGPGLAFIYVREDLIPKLRPTVAGWFSARDQFQFRTTDFEYKDTASRLEAGTPAIAPIYTASASLDMILEIGVERIRERTMFLADDLVRRVQAKGWPVRSPLDGTQRSSIVMLGLDRPDELVKALSERGIVVDYRPGLLRISPHFYNTVEENQIIVDALDELLRQRGS